VTSAEGDAGQGRGKSDTTPQTAAGKVLCTSRCLGDGFVAGPGRRPGLVDEYVETTGAVLRGRAGWDGTVEDARPCSGAWDGAMFVLTPPSGRRSSR